VEYERASPDGVSFVTNASENPRNVGCSAFLVGKSVDVV
jgi:hypothetical protein